MADITSANAKLILTVDELYPQGVALEQFGTDQSFGVDPVEIAETRMGVDGHMTAGYVPAIHTVTVTLEASSPSRMYLAHLASAMKANRKIYDCTLVAVIPSIGETITWRGGVLKSAPVTSGSGKTLNATVWTFDFEDYDKTVA